MNSRSGSFWTLLSVWIVAGLAGCSAFSNGNMESIQSKMESGTSVSTEEIESLKSGSRVELVCRTPYSTHTYVGKVLHADAQGVTLLDCEMTQEIRLDGKKLNSIRKSTPVESVNATNISSVRLLDSKSGDLFSNLDMSTEDRIRMADMMRSSRSYDR